MPIDPRHLGRRYGPYRFEVGLERIRDFVAAVGGGVPGRVFSAPPPGPHPFTWDEAAARASRHGGLIAPPAFATAFAIQPFAVACSDPELEVNVLRLVHGEQEFEFLEPIRPGDVIATVGEITRIQERGNLDFLEVTTESTNQRGRLVVRGVWTAIVRN
ncbi:MAG TPA: MaoC family dehydratase N-terminal domain-containing protein [Anaeromyxobacteraceae bacterium]|nr:MaoC family dehydratase N-terminal domain-containing protein [Anaeromyxobacteraceae bacterium]